MAGVGPTAGGSALLGRRAAQPSNVRIVASSVSSLRVRPFLAAKSSGRPQLRVRSAEPEASAVAEVSPKATTEEDDFEFSYSGAKKNNQYSAADVEAALRLFDGEGTATEFEQDHVSNQTGMEDASYFDDIDNVEGYEDDEYATAGIAEAAPKKKRSNDRQAGPAEGNDEGDEIEKAKDVSASQKLEDDAIARAQAEEMDPETAAEEMDDGADNSGESAVWSWLADYENQSDIAMDDLSMGGGAARLASVPSENEVLGGLAKGIAGGEELDANTREYLDFLADDVALEQELIRLDGEEVDVIPESSQDSAEDEARIARLLATEFEDLEDINFADDEEEFESVDREAYEGMDESALEAYLATLRSIPSQTGEEADEATQAKFFAALAAKDADDVTAEATEIADSDMDDAEVAALEALLARAPSAQSADDAADDQSLLAAFASDFEDEDDLEADDVDQAAAYQLELSALMLENIGWTDEDTPTDEALEVYASFLRTGEEYLAGEALRRTELSAMVARGELPMEALEEELADPADPEITLYESVLERAESFDEGPDVMPEDMEEDHVNWQERIIELKRVTKVTKGGKVMGFRCTAVIGNQAGLVGVGCDSGREVGIAVKRALVDAKKNVIRVPLVGSGTIPHRSEAKYKAARCVLRPASEGTGVIAGGSIRSVLELAGVQNCLAKRLGCRTLLTNARATIKALSTLKTLGQVAEARGVPYAELLVPSRR